MRYAVKSDSQSIVRSYEKAVSWLASCRAQYVPTFSRFRLELTSDCSQVHREVPRPFAKADISRDITRPRSKR